MSPRLEQHLLERGLIAKAHVEAALERQRAEGGALDTALLELGKISEAGVLQALADVSGMRAVNLADFEPGADVAELIPAKLSEQLRAVPLSVDGDALHVASAFPVATRALEEIAQLLGKRLEPWVAIECRIEDWASQIYKRPPHARFASLLAALDPSRPVPLIPATKKPPELAPEPTTDPELAVPAPAARLEERGTLEQALLSEMAPQRPQPEPILLELKKPARVKTPLLTPHVTIPPPLPRSSPSELPSITRSETVIVENLHEEVRTVVVDTSEYEAYVRDSAPKKNVKVETVAPMVAPVALKSEEPKAPSAIAPSEEPERWRVLPSPAALAAPQVASGRELVMPKGYEQPPATEPTVEVSRLADLAHTLEEVPDWTLEQARTALKGAASDRDRLIDVALRYARRTFEFSAAFATVRGAAVGWSARGENTQVDWITQVSIPLDAASVFRTAAVTRGSYVGPPPSDSYTPHYLGMLGRSPRTVFLFPVEVKSRLVALVYGDNGSKPVSQRRLSDLLLFCQGLSSAFQELILYRKQHGAASSEPDAPRAPSSPLSGWSPASTASSASMGRGATLPAPVASEQERPPPDFEPLLRRLTGPDAAQRAAAMAELARTPEASAKVLAKAFPGPTAWARLPVQELPEADELGPIAGALARLGRAGAQALGPLLDEDDADTRYLALLTAGSLPYPELVDGVLRGLFDLEPDISSAARVSAAALRPLPRFDSAMKDLRQELAATDPLRRALAARALGALHDRQSIDGLIGLTGSDDQLCAQAAADALREIAKLSLGPHPRLWSMWWAENRGRRRADWLVAALRHEDLDLRLSAIEELSRAYDDSLGYVADAPPALREAAAARWEQRLGGEGQRRLES